MRLSKDQQQLSRDSLTATLGSEHSLAQLAKVWTAVKSQGSKQLPLDAASYVTWRPVSLSEEVQVLPCQSLGSQSLYLFAGDPKVTNRDPK